MTVYLFSQFESVPIICSSPLFLLFLLYCKLMTNSMNVGFLIFFFCLISYFTYASTLKISAFIYRVCYDNLMLQCCLNGGQKQMLCPGKQERTSVATHLMHKISFLLQVGYPPSFSSRSDILVDGYTGLDRNIISIVATGLSLWQRSKTTNIMTVATLEIGFYWMEIIMVPFPSRT